MTVWRPLGDLRRCHAFRSASARRAFCGQGFDAGDAPVDAALVVSSQVQSCSVCRKRSGTELGVVRPQGRLWR